MREQRRSATSAAAITAAVRDYFAQSEVRPADYRPLVAEMPGRDPDDRMHIAAAVAGGARMIITWNRADFPAEPLAVLGVRVCDPDRYLCDLLAEHGQEITATVVRLAGEKRRPPMTVEDLVNALDKAGMTAFGRRLRVALHDHGYPLS